MKKEQLNTCKQIRLLLSKAKFDGLTAQAMGEVFNIIAAFNDMLKLEELPETPEIKEDAKS